MAQHTQAELEAAKAEHTKKKGVASGTGQLLKHLVAKGALVESELPTKLKILLS